jgi:hypothetical protein
MSKVVESKKSDKKEQVNLSKIWVLTIVNSDCDDDEKICNYLFKSFDQAKEQLISDLEDFGEQKLMDMVTKDKSKKGLYLESGQYTLKIDDQSL